VAATSLLVGFAWQAEAATASAPFKVSLRRTEEKIRETVLEQTPLGSRKPVVLAFIEQRLRHVGEPEQLNSGARRVTYGPGGVDDRVGVSSIERLEVGHFGEWRYLLLIKTYVYLSWAFDADGRLIDVIVYKETDTL
jgi:hypothetical protein